MVRLGGADFGKIGWNGKKVFEKVNWKLKIVVYGIVYGFV